MKKIAIHQPNLLPRLKVLQKLFNCDIWVVSDDVQYSQREWQNRTRIFDKKTHKSFWLGIPVSLINGSSTTIKDVVVYEPQYNFRLIKRTLEYVFTQYKNSILLNDIFYTSEFLWSNNVLLKDLTVFLISQILKLLNKEVSIIYASDLNVSGKSSRYISDICAIFNDCIYLADSGGYRYMKEQDFQKTSVMWQNWVEPLPESPINLPWRNYSYINFLMEYGLLALGRHLAAGQFLDFPDWQKITIYNNEKN